MKIIEIKTAAIIILTTVCGIFQISANEPVKVGHRGSLFGLENTGASFANGALRGYQYLETDFKLSGDSVLVCTHDNDLGRLGGSLPISGSPASALCSETLSQKRGGVPYKAHLATADRYVDVCLALGAKPLIELKWTEGINSNDCSNMPILLDFLDRKGIADKCIILTSMKPCLEYIRKNRPEIELQFLTGKYWENHFDWCVEQGIDADIQAGCFDSTTVEKFHNAGLKVNVWCANNETDYEKYKTWGCDFITTDRYVDDASTMMLEEGLPRTLDESLALTQILDLGESVACVFTLLDPEAKIPDEDYMRELVGEGVDLPFDQLVEIILVKPDGDVIRYGAK